VTAAPVTLAEIARRAGVHVSTVSRALSAEARGVGSATTERIRLLAEELGYLPHPAAAELRTGRSGLLGVLVPDLRDMVLSTIYAGVDARAHESVYSTFVSNTHDDPDLRGRKLEELLARRVEGVILGDARMDGDELVEKLKRRGLPYVLVNRRLRGNPSVTTDDIAGGSLAAEHLLSLGHEDVGVVAGPTYASTAVERTHGFVTKYLRSGKNIPDDRIVNGIADAPGGHKAADELLTAHPGITAIFAANDFAAIGAMGAIREHGRTPGKDVAIIGYNDVPLAAYLPVPLASVRSPMLEMGRQGAAMLIELLEGRPVEPLLLTPELVVRDSAAWGANKKLAPAAPLAGGV
jgi:LacI family transcriptional regulator